jgi:hypothetical protein
MRSHHLYLHLVCFYFFAIAQSVAQRAALHPDYKLTYIKHVWGGAKEQDDE